MLTAERLRELVAYDPVTGEFRWKSDRAKGKCKAGSIAGSVDGRYMALNIDHQKVWSHRAVWLYVTGVWPTNKIDHIDGNGLNNAWSNLRDVSQKANSQNHRRLRVNNTSGYTGVSRKRGAWVSRIRTEGTTHWLGAFEDPAKASEVYIEAKRQLHEGCTI